MLRLQMFPLPKQSVVVQSVLSRLFSFRTVLLHPQFWIFRCKQRTYQTSRGGYHYVDLLLLLLLLLVLLQI